MERYYLIAMLLFATSCAHDTSVLREYDAATELQKLENDLDEPAMGLSFLRFRCSVWSKSPSCKNSWRTDDVQVVDSGKLRWPFPIEIGVIGDDDDLVALADRTEKLATRSGLKVRKRFSRAGGKIRIIEVDDDLLMSIVERFVKPVGFQNNHDSLGYWHPQIVFDIRPVSFPNPTHRVPCYLLLEARQNQTLAFAAMLLHEDRTSGEFSWCLQRLPLAALGLRSVMPLVAQPDLDPIVARNVDIATLEEEHLPLLYETDKR